MDLLNSIAEKEEKSKIDAQNQALNYLHVHEDGRRRPCSLSTSLWVLPPKLKVFNLFLTMSPAGKHYKLGKYYVAHKVLNLTTNCIFSHLLLRSWPLVVMWSWSIMIKKRMDLLMVYVSFKPLTWRLDSSIHPFLYILKTLENSFDIDLGNVKSTTHFCVFVIWFPRNCRHRSIFPENFLEKNTVRIPLKSWIVKDNVWDSFQFPL